MHAFPSRRLPRLLGPALLGLLLLLGAVARAESMSVRLSSKFLVRGEQAVLEYVLPEGASRASELDAPSVEGVNIRSIGAGAERLRGFNRRPEYVFRFSVSSYEPGTYEIPPVTLEDNGTVYTGRAQTIRIFHETDLEWSSVEVAGESLEYAAAFRVADNRPFVKEVLPIELKLYVPANQRIEDWGIPEFDRDGLAAWRFEPRPSVGRANLRGDSHYAVSYPSTLSPTEAGDVSLGPGELRLITVQTSVRDFGSAFYEPANLEIPVLRLEARELPPGAPEGFQDAVGSFDLSVTSDQTEVREGDPVSVDMMVSGTGNLDTLDPPQPVEPEGWKLYPTSRTQDDSRRRTSGEVGFRQFMRPLRMQDQIPPFRLSYFDPDDESYRTIYSDGLPLTVLPSTNAPRDDASAPMALPVPVEEMTDILGTVDAAGRLLPAPGRSLPWSWWHIIPAALAIALLIRIAMLHLRPKLRKDPDKEARRRDLRELDRSPKDAVGFYRRAGQIVEKWLGQSDDELARDVLAKRDQTCFNHDVESQSVSRDERQRVLRGLRRLVLPLLALAAFLSGAPELAAQDNGESPAEAAAEAYEEGRYGEAAELWLETGPYERLPADILYNIGNAAYRLGVPGEAALYWRRALARDETHAEARQNLRFLERKFGAIVIDRPDHQYVLARLPLGVWTGAAWLGGWLAVLGILVFPATRPGANLRTVAITGLVSAPVLAGAGLAGWYYYPDDARFAPLSEQVVVIDDRSTIRTDAARNAPEVIEAPAGSLCQVIDRSGDWAYVSFTNETRGWVPENEIAPVLTEETPRPPEAPGPAQPGKSA